MAQITNYKALLIFHEDSALAGAVQYTVSRYHILLPDSQIGFIQGGLDSLLYLTPEDPLRFADCIVWCVL